jgi:hypothetical protein
MGFYYGTRVLLSTLSNAIGILAFLPPTFNNDLSLKSGLLCQIMWQARLQLIAGVTYHQTLITVDLMLNTLYINRFLFLKKWQNLAFMCVAIQVGVALSNMAQWWRYIKSTPVVTESNSTNVTTFSLSCSAPPTQALVNSFVSIINRIAPAICNTCMSVVIIYCLVKSKRHVDSSKNLPKRLITFAISLIAQNAVYFIMVTPHAVSSALQIRNTLTGQTGSFVNLTGALNNLFIWGVYSYEAFPFFLNLAFNRLFREEIFTIFKGVNHLSVAGDSSLNGSLKLKTLK